MTLGTLPCRAAALLRLVVEQKPRGQCSGRLLSGLDHSCGYRAYGRSSHALVHVTSCFCLETHPTPGAMSLDEGGLVPTLPALPSSRSCRSLHGVRTQHLVRGAGVADSGKLYGREWCCSVIAAPVGVRTGGRGLRPGAEPGLRSPGKWMHAASWRLPETSTGCTKHEVLEGGDALFQFVAFSQSV